MQTGRDGERDGYMESGVGSDDGRDGGMETWNIINLSCIDFFNVLSYTAEKLDSERCNIDHDHITALCIVYDNK